MWACVYVCVHLYVSVHVCLCVWTFIVLIKLFLSLRPKIAFVAFFWVHVHQEVLGFLNSTSIWFRGSGVEHSPHSLSECANTRLDVAPVPTDIHLPILERCPSYPVTYLNADCLQWFVGLVEEHSDQ